MEKSYALTVLNALAMLNDVDGDSTVPSHGSSHLQKAALCDTGPARPKFIL